MHAADPTELRVRLDEAFSIDAPVVIEAAAGPMPDPWPFFLPGRARGAG